GERRAGRGRAARQGERGLDLQEPDGRGGGTAHRRRRAQGGARGTRAHLGAACELHRERGRGTSGGREGAHGPGPARGVGAERGMAGARGSARRELVGRLFGARNRRRGPRLGPTVRATLAVVFPGAALLGGLAFAWPYAAAAARRHPYFAVREVVVRQNHRVPAAEIRRVARIEPGMSVWDVDAPSAEERLRAHDWIRAAHVRRELPHRVVIQVREERPVAILAVDDGKAGEYYVAAHGRGVGRGGAREPRAATYVSRLPTARLP